MAELRLATPEDEDVIAWHRARMFQEMGALPDEMVDRLGSATALRLRDLIRAGVYIGWLAEDPSLGQVVAGVGLCLRSVLSIPVVVDPGVTAIVDGRSRVPFSLPRRSSTRTPDPPHVDHHLRSRGSPGDAYTIPNDGTWSIRRPPVQG